MEKIDSGMEDALKDRLNDEPTFSDNTIKTIRMIVDAFANNPTFNRFIKPAINTLTRGVEKNLFPKDMTAEILQQVVYDEGIMKFGLCAPQECKKVVYDVVSKAKKYTDANEEANDQESFYKLVRGLALKKLESKILLKTGDPVFIDRLRKHKRGGVPFKMLIDVEEALVNLYNEINLNNY